MEPSPDIDLQEANLIIQMIEGSFYCNEFFGKLPAIVSRIQESLRQTKEKIEAAAQPENGKPNMTRLAEVTSLSTENVFFVHLAGAFSSSARGILECQIELAKGTRNLAMSNPEEKYNPEFLARLISFAQIYFTRVHFLFSAVNRIILFDALKDDASERMLTERQAKLAELAHDDLQEKLEAAIAVLKKSQQLNTANSTDEMKSAGAEVTVLPTTKIGRLPPTLCAAIPGLPSTDDVGEKTPPLRKVFVPRIVETDKVVP